MVFIDSVKKNYDKLVMLFIMFLYSLVFLQVINLWLSYATMELYNYLTITPIIIFIILIPFLRKTSSSISAKKYLLYLLFYLGGAGLVFYSTVSETYADQLIIGGMITLLYSIILLFVDEKLLFRILLVFPAIIIMVPLPSGFVFNFSAILTRIVLSIAIPLTRLAGVPIYISESSGYLIVNVMHNNNYVPFHIAPVCSGIIGLFSVYAMVPLMIFIGLSGEKKLSRRIIGGIIGSILLAILMFFANVIRLFSVFYFTSLYGIDVGYGIFHYTPELVMIIPIVFIVIKILDYISGNVKIIVSFKNNQDNDGKTGKNVSIFSRKTLALFILPLLLLTPLAIPLIQTSYLTPSIIFVDTYKGPILLFNITEGVKKDFVPLHYHNIRFKYMGRIREFEESLGPTTRVHIYRGLYGYGKVLDIYVEFSHQPSGIHVWELCLWWQNMNVTPTRIMFFSDRSGEIRFIVRELNFSARYMHGYLIYWRDKVYTEDGIEYSRVTVMITSMNRKINVNDIKLVKSLSRLLVMKELDASYAKYGKVSGFDINYYYSTILPSAIIITILYFIVIDNVYLRKVVKFRKIWLKNKLCGKNTI